MSERDGLELNVTDAICMLLLDTCVSVWWALTTFHEKHYNSKRVMQSARKSVFLCSDMCNYFFCNKRLFNTCVTTGTSQLKSNTLSVYITCWVY